jgi:sulfur-oxidizing protein SoxX
MRTPARYITTVSTVATLIGALALPPVAASAEEKPKSAFELGKALAFDNKEGGELAGNIGPALAAMKDRFSKEKLRAQIFDASKSNPNTIMPPFGRHGILSEDELNKVVEFVYTL